MLLGASFFPSIELEWPLGHERACFCEQLPYWQLLILPRGLSYGLLRMPVAGGRSKWTWQDRVGKQVEEGEGI